MVSLTQGGAPSPLDGLERARALVGAIPDPEIPVVSLADLGILRAVDVVDGHIVVTLTPTYTGCPATEAIAQDARRVLAEGGFADARVRLTLSPPWTTDWISAEGRRKLREYGIAPPGRRAEGPSHSPIRFFERAVDTPACPRCGATEVERLSAYGSTPCKSLYRCRACREPFDYFKPY